MSGIAGPAPELSAWNHAANYRNPGGGLSGRPHYHFLGVHNIDVFFHELAHAAHDKVDPNFCNRTKNDKEVIAEFSAAVLMSIYGYDHSKGAWEYINAFSQDPIKAIMKALNTVGDVLALILENETLENETDESQTESYQRLAVVAA